VGFGEELESFDLNRIVQLLVEGSKGEEEQKEAVDRQNLVKKYFSFLF